jgi:peptidoglycan/xylan/chitin deacetylase (PgdA/CDA1 family)
MRALGQAGYVNVDWTANGADWTRGISSDAICSRVMDGCDCSDGAVNVVLLHSWPVPTARALGQIISALQERSAEFSLVDALPGFVEKASNLEQGGDSGR